VVVAKFVLVAVAVYALVGFNGLYTKVCKASLMQSFCDTLGSGVFGESAKALLASIPFGAASLFLFRNWIRDLSWQRHIFLILTLLVVSVIVRLFSS
jgi:hypothetical protein